MPEPTIQLYPSIRGLDREGWNALNQASGACPFLSWEFLALLEESGAVGEEAGWQPLHAILSGGGRWLAAAPFYAAADPRGQFTWDGGMDAAADAYGLPGFLSWWAWCPSPLAPVAAARGCGSQGAAAAQALVDAVAGAAREGGYLGFAPAVDTPALRRVSRAVDGGRDGLLAQAGLSMENTGYADFEALPRLPSPRTCDAT